MHQPRTRTLLATVVATVALSAATATTHTAQAAESRGFVVAQAQDDETFPVPASVDSGRDIATFTPAELEAAIMVEVNEARAANGLRKIRSFDACTDRLAGKWAGRIARTGQFEHRDQGEVIRRCNTSWAGETLVRGEGLSPKAMVELWLDSPGHREILLSPRAKRAGVGVARDSQGRTVGVVNMVRQR